MATFKIVGSLPAAGWEDRRPSAARRGAVEMQGTAAAVLDPEQSDSTAPAFRPSAGPGTPRPAPADQNARCAAHQKDLEAEYQSILDAIVQIGRALRPAEGPTCASETPNSKAPCAPGFAPASPRDVVAAAPRDRAPADSVAGDKTVQDAEPLRPDAQGRKDVPAAWGPAPGAEPLDGATAAEDLVRQLRRWILAQTARPGSSSAAGDSRGIVVTFAEAALTSLRHAREQIVERQSGAAAQSLRRSVDILGELEAIQEFTPADELAPGLRRIYSYCRRRVMESHQHGDPEGLNEAARLLTSLRDAWLAAPDRGWSVGP